jgi:hypothetical protein
MTTLGNMILVMTPSSNSVKSDKWLSTRVCPSMIGSRSSHY